MKTLSPYSRLQNSIQLLEEEQIIKRQLLKEQLIISYESLKPLNLFSSAVRDISSYPDIRDNVLGSAVGLASGFLTKKIFVGTSGNVIRKLLGFFIQVGVANTVAKHPETIRTFGQFIKENFLSGKETKSVNRIG